MVQPAKKVAVIGAGVSGVAAAAHLKAAGVPFTLFERAKTAGGVWVFDPRLAPEPAYPSLIPSVAESAYYADSVESQDLENTGVAFKDTEDVEILHAPPGLGQSLSDRCNPEADMSTRPCYESLRNNVPTGLMTLKLNSWPLGTEQIVKHNILAEYIQDTAAKTGINDFAQYNTRVESVSKEQDHWKVRTSTFDARNLKITTKDSASNRDIKQSKLGQHSDCLQEFDFVVIATGHYHAPKVPDIPGLKDWKNAWPSRIQHSKRYRNTRGFEGKNVVLIGGSTSSFDIAKDLVGTAKTVYQSTRGGEFDHPISMLPAGVKRIAEIASFNLDLQQHTFEDAAIPGFITLVNGQFITGIDRVIICTGYHCTYPFLSQYHRDSVLPSGADETTLVTDGSQMHNLHKDIFYIPDPTLAFIGVPYHIATFSLFEFQAITVAAVFSGKALVPAEADARAEYQRKLAKKGSGRAFHSLKGKDVEYADDLLAWINPGIVAAGGKPVEGHTQEWQAQYDLLRARLKDAFQGRPAAALQPSLEKQSIRVVDSRAGEPIQVAN